MKTLLFWCFGLYLIFTASIAQAQLKSGAQDLVDQYIAAFRADDESGMNAIFDRITNDPVLYESVKKDYPQAYSLINLRHILRRIDDMERRYGNGSHKRSVVAMAPDTLLVTYSSSGHTSGTLRGNRDNRSISRDFPNQQHSPNQFRTLLTNNHMRTNSAAVRAYSNQDRVRNQTNQQRLRSRR